MKEITTEQYFKELIRQFPNLKKEMDEWEPEYSHMKMECFASFTSLQLKEHNHTEFMRCLAFQESMIEVMNDELQNCLYVSYCETLLEYVDEMKEKTKFMPPKFREKYETYARHYFSFFLGGDYDTFQYKK
jgi:hypothetical protein